MRKLFMVLALISATVLGSMYAQSPDPRFSQFYAAPMQLNPAMTGVFDGSFRVVVNYRDQYASILETDPFRTLAFSFDYKHNIVGDDYIAGGLDLMGDQAGVTRLKHTRGHFNLSYLKKLSGRGYNSQAQYLIAGAQVGVGQGFIDQSDIWFTSQFDAAKEEIDYSLNSGERIEENSNLYTNINTGLMWYGVIDKDFSIYAGAAINHINRPKFTFLGDQTQEMHQRWLVHVGGQIPLSRELSILPGAVYMQQGPSTSANFGFNFRYTNRDWHELALRIGSWMHLSNELENSTLSDALILTGAIEWTSFNFGFSYDFNASSLTDATNGRSAFELSITYVSKEVGRRLKVNCPTF